MATAPPSQPGDGAHGLTTSVTCDVDSFAALAGEWDALLERSTARSYFLRHAWNLAWWHHFSPVGSRLHLLTCRDAANRLVGLVPLYRVRRSLFGLVTLTELRFLGTGIETKTSEYLDILAESGSAERVYRAVAEHLQHDSWDRLWLHQIPATSATLSQLQTRWPAAVITSADRAPYIDTSQDWQAFKATLGRSMRRNVEYYPRRLFRKHACEFALATSEAAVNEGLAALVRLHQARWRAQGESGAFRGSTLAAMLRQVAVRGLPLGQTRLWTLRIDGQIEAALLGFVDRGILHYFQKGFNPAFSRDELGNVTVALSVRACCDDPAISAFDFMGGGAPYKTMWTSLRFESCTFEIQRPNSRTTLFKAQGRLRDGAIEVLRKVTPTPLRAARRAYLKSRQLERT